MKYMPAMRLILAVISVIVLYGYAGERHKRTRLTGRQIIFMGEATPLITTAKVNKMLIQNLATDSVRSLDGLDLNEGEERLEANEMIRNAEVSLSLDGILRVEIEQRLPIARVVGDPSVYLCEDGGIMPLSSEYTELVPLVFNYDARRQEDLHKLLMQVKTDPWLDKLVSQVYTGENGVDLGLRVYNFRVKVGSVDGLTDKFYNLKAYISYAKQNGSIDSLKSVDLRFKDQVVTRKNKG